MSQRYSHLKVTSKSLHHRKREIIFTEENCEENFPFFLVALRLYLFAVCEDDSAVYLGYKRMMIFSSNRYFSCKLRSDLRIVQENSSISSIK